MTATNLRFAPHLGYLSLEQPLFLESVGSIDPVDHARFAARIGFSGIFDPWMTSRPADEIERLVGAVRDCQLEIGAIAYAPFQAMFTPLFARDGESAWADISEHLDRAIELAGRCGAKTIAIVLQGSGGSNLSAQLGAAAQHLRRAGDRAARRNLQIGIEPMVALADLMLGTTAQAVELLDRIDHPAVQMIFDTGHVQDMDGDIHSAWRLARDHVGTIQLADMPGRVEPGAGDLDFTRFLVDAVRDGKAGGLIELEHGWSTALASTEQAGIARLRAIDAAVRSVIESIQPGPAR